MMVVMMMVMVVVVVMVMHDLLRRSGVSEYVCWKTLAEVIGKELEILVWRGYRQVIMG